MVSLNLYTLLFEIITVLWQAFWGTMKAFGTAIWDNLPAILEIKKVMGYFTPAGMIALYLGVPTIVISVLFFLIRRAVKKENWKMVIKNQKTLLKPLDKWFCPEYNRGVIWLWKTKQHHGSAFGWTIPTKHHSRQQKTFWTLGSRYDCYIRNLKF